MFGGACFCFFKKLHKCWALCWRVDIPVRKLPSLVHSEHTKAKVGPWLVAIVIDYALYLCCFTEQWNRSLCAYSCSWTGGFHTIWNLTWWEFQITWKTLYAYNFQMFQRECGIHGCEHSDVGGGSELHRGAHLHSPQGAALQSGQGGLLLLATLEDCRTLQGST